MTPCLKYGVTRVRGQVHVVISYWNIYNEDKTTDLILYREQKTRRYIEDSRDGFSVCLQIHVHMYASIILYNVSGKSPAVGRACAVK